MSVARHIGSFACYCVSIAFMVGASMLNYFDGSWLALVPAVLASTAFAVGDWLGEGTP